MDPRVTIVIANYNYTRFLDKAIQSVVNQNYPKHLLSIVVVDDASTDNPQSVLDAYGDNVDGVNLYTIHNETTLGPSAARNKAIELMWDKTDIFGILDADDEMLPHKTKALVNEIVTSGGFVGVAYADYIIVDETGWEKIEFKEPFNRSRLHRECIVHSGAFISKKALEYAMQDGYFYDPEMRTCEDYDLWIRIARQFLITHVPIPLSKVLVHSQNSTNTVDKAVWQRNWQRIWNKLTASQSNQRQ
jgi:glycosyltransferase involved in cell wall biosynthesis